MPSDPVGASQITVAGPPATAIFLSLPAATKPRYRLSGDQKGPRQFSVPGSGFAMSALSGRSQTMVRLVESCATKAMVRPSGEMQGWKSGVSPAGALIVNWSCCFGAGPPSPPRHAKNAAAAIASPATAHAIGSRLTWRFGSSIGPVAPECVPDCESHESWSLMSCAVWMRSSGSLARQARTSASSAGAAIELELLIGIGSDCMTAPIRLACDLPSNARLPVAIS